MLVLQLGMVEDMANLHFTNPGDMGKSDHILQSSAKPPQNCLSSPKLLLSEREKNCYSE